MPLRDPRTGVDDSRMDHNFQPVQKKRDALEVQRELTLVSIQKLHLIQQITFFVPNSLKLEQITRKTEIGPMSTVLKEKIRKTFKKYFSVKHTH